MTIKMLLKSTKLCKEPKKILNAHTRHASEPDTTYENSTRNKVKKKVYIQFGMAF